MVQSYGALHQKNKKQKIIPTKKMIINYHGLVSVISIIGIQCT